jgi:uncharacterized protein YgiM (DUF1202 family)
VSLLLALVLLAAVPLSASAAKKTVSILKVSADYARLRSEPGAGGDVVATLRKDSKVFYLGRSGSMAYVCTERGQMGYIYAGYLAAYGKVPLASIYYVKSSSLSVYKSASTSSRKLGSIPKNGYILLRETNGNWGFIRSLSGNSGYVLLSGLKRAA